MITCWERADSWLSFVMFHCVFVIFPSDILGQVWYLIVSIPDLCQLSYFDNIRGYPSILGSKKPLLHFILKSVMSVYLGMFEHKKSMFLQLKILNVAIRPKYECVA